MRVFLAVELPAPLRERIASAAAELLQGPGGAPLPVPVPLPVRFVATSDLHVTVRFLGEIDDSSPSEWLAPLAAAVARVPAGSACAHGWGAFPSARRPRVVWCGVSAGRETLVALERAVSAALTPFGFPPESRAFHPHITVARVRSQRGGRHAGRHHDGRHDGQRDGQRDGHAALARALRAGIRTGTRTGSETANEHGEMAGGAFPVSRLTVFRSHLSRTGVRYEALHRLPLQDDPVTNTDSRNNTPGER